MSNDEKKKALEYETSLKERALHDTTAMSSTLQQTIQSLQQEWHRISAQKELERNRIHHLEDELSKPWKTDEKRDNSKNKRMIGIDNKSSRKKKSSGTSQDEESTSSHNLQEEIMVYEEALQTAAKQRVTLEKSLSQLLKQNEEIGVDVQTAAKEAKKMSQKARNHNNELRSIERDRALVQQRTRELVIELESLGKQKKQLSIRRKHYDNEFRDLQAERKECRTRAGVEAEGAEGRQVTVDALRMENARITDLLFNHQVVKAILQDSLLFPPLLKEGEGVDLTSNKKENLRESLEIEQHNQLMVELGRMLNDMKH